MASFGDFKLGTIAGTGGMATVYRAIHVSSGHRVAVKLLHADAPIGTDQFRQEAAAAAQLSHPSIVQIFDFGTHDGRPYLVMELLEGGTAADIEFSWPALRHLLLSVLDALAHAHARGVVHRDLKPANLLRDERGAWRLVDFGLAGAAPASGTLAYMAPEQLRGAGLDGRTDLYALGLLAWVLTTGCVPRGGTPSQVLRHSDAPDAWVYQPALPVPEGFLPWIQSLVCPHPDDRLPTAAHAAAALSALPMPIETGSLGPGDHFAGATFTLEMPLRSVLNGALGTVSSVRLPLPPPNHEVPPSRPLPAALGLGLLGLRPLPFVGRRAERQRLWSAVIRVREQGDAVLVNIVGPNGCGRRRLGQWVLYRCLELGLAGSRDFRLHLVETPADVPEALAALACGQPALVVSSIAFTHGHPDTETIRLERLSPGDMRSLCHRIVPLVPGVMARLEAAADGRPTVLRKLLEAWVEADWLRPSANGWRLEEQDVTDPDLDMRLREWAGARGARAVDVAAALGDRVATHEWHEIAEDCPSVDRAVNLGLGSQVTDGFLWAPRARWQARNAARRRGTYAQAHASCLAIVQEPSRRWRHQLEGGEAEEAVATLMSLGSAMVAASDTVRSGYYLELALGLAQTTLGPTDPRTLHIQGWVAWDHLTRVENNAGEVAQDLLEKASVANDPGLQGSALHTLGAASTGAVREDYYARAVTLYKAAGQFGDARAVRTNGLIVAAMAGRPDAEAARQLLRAKDNYGMRSLKWYALAHQLEALGDVEGCLEAYEKAASLGEVGAAKVVNSTSYAKRLLLLDRFDACEGALQRAMSTLLDDNWIRGRTQLLAVELALQRGQWSLAEQTLSRLTTPTLSRQTQVLWAVLYAAHRDRESFDRTVREPCQFVTVAVLDTLCGALWREAGDERRAAACFQAAAKAAKDDWSPLVRDRVFSTPGVVRPQD